VIGLIKIAIGCSDLAGDCSEERGFFIGVKASAKIYIVSSERYASKLLIRISIFNGAAASD